MRTTRLSRSALSVSAAVEVLTGLAIILFPDALIRLLFDTDASGVTIVIGRVAGIALISLGLGCWMSRQEASRGWALAAMLSYNALITIFFTVVGVGAEFVGMLLWPAVALHAGFTALLAYPLVETRVP